VKTITLSEQDALRAKIKVKNSEGSFLSKGSKKEPWRLRLQTAASV